MNTHQIKPENHPFLSKPHHTIIFLSFPILLSLIAEPVTGLIDTGFVAQLGTVSLAALGVSTGALSSVFWIFGFLGIGTQTEVSQTYGKGQIEASIKSVSLAMTLGVIVSLLLIFVLMPNASSISALLGAEGIVLEQATLYIQVRLFGAPAVIITIVGFGALRGIQDMKTPLWIALIINITNIVLDYPFIFGWQFIPAMGVGGAALASVISQWLGTGWMLWKINQKLGFTRDFNLSDGINLIKIGRDLFIRTGLLTLFMLIGTRVATQISAEAGAAHQVIRQIWFFTALVMEAFATTAQSLIGYFYGAQHLDYAKRVARITTVWSLGTGIVLMVGMLATTQLVTDLLVPDDTVAVFLTAWLVAALSQPLNAIAFITDGIHWGTSDYSFLRNAMICATVIGLIGLQLIPIDHSEAFMYVWVVSVIWIGIRAFWGFLRVYPGIGDSPFRESFKIKIKNS
jgi:multidrug resistance protein, MATE family